MQVSFNLWTLFFVVATVQGILLSVMLFLKKSTTNKLLGGLILSFSLCLGYYVIFWTGYYLKLPWQLGAAQGLTLVFGPLAYFYLRSDHKTHYFDSRHFLPLVLYVGYFILDLPPKEIPGYYLALFQIIHLIVYSVLIFKWLSTNRRQTNGAIKRYRWRRKVALAFTGYTISFIAYYVLVWTGLLKIEYDYMISVASSFFIYFIGYYGFQKHEILKMNEPSRYEKSSLDNSINRSIMEKLQALISQEKIHLKSSLKLHEVADIMEISSHHLSQAINETKGIHFTDFINEHRVAEAKKQLRETDHKILHIALDSGFNNKVTFHNAFKKATSMSPGEYRNLVLEKA